MQFSLPDYIKREPRNRSGQKYKSVLKGRMLGAGVPRLERGSGEPLSRTRALTSHFQIKPLRKPNQWRVETGRHQNAQRRLSGI
jgi:hypothetical protein